jgi:hypothetical protein
MFHKFISTCAKFSDDLRQYSQVIHLERLPAGDTMATFTNGFFAVVYHYVDGSPISAGQKMLLPLGARHSMPVSDYPDMKAALGGDHVANPNTTENMEWVRACEKIQASLNQVKISRKTYLDPRTWEFSHEGEKPGTIRADWLTAYVKLGKYLQYHGEVSPDCHHFSIGGNGYKIHFFCVAVVEK